MIILLLALSCIIGVCVAIEYFVTVLFRDKNYYINKK